MVSIAAKYIRASHFLDLLVMDSLVVLFFFFQLRTGLNEKGCSVKGIAFLSFQYIK